MNAWSRCVVSAVLASSCSGFLIGSQGSDKGADTVEMEYQQRLKAWKSYTEKPEVRFSSNSSVYTSNEPYNRIVALGPPALPFLIGSIGGGEFLLNDAVQRITGVDVRNLYPNEKVVGEQDLSKLWVRWWNEKGRLAQSK